MPPSPTGPVGVQKPKAKPVHTKNMIELLKAVEEELDVRAATEAAAKGGLGGANAQLPRAAQVPKPKPKVDASVMKPWAEIDKIYRDMSVLLSRTPMDVHSVAVALREVRRLQSKLQVLICNIEKRHARY